MRHIILGKMDSSFLSSLLLSVIRLNFILKGGNFVKTIHRNEICRQL